MEYVTGTPQQSQQTAKGEQGLAGQQFNSRSPGAPADVHTGPSPSQPHTLKYSAQLLAGLPPAFGTPRPGLLGIACLPL